jgi:PhzF family phenazine biosynthesis protein
VGCSEAAFVESQGSRGQYGVRYFIPQAEMAFCGHATSAAAVAIADRGGPGFLQFSTLVGPIPVQTSVTSD